MATAPAAKLPPAASTVLLAFDGSLHSEAALVWFARKIDLETKFIDRRLIIFYSVEAPPLPRGNTTLLMSKTELYAGLIRDSTAEIDSLRRKTLALCQRLGVSARVSFVDKYEADAGKAIVAMAAAEKADLILIGSRGLNSVKKTFLGSVSDYVVHHAHRPVVVVPMHRLN